jgi:uncharacterized protein with PQ loop repeat
MITEIIGWIGVITGIIVSFPQLIKSYKEKSTQGVSKNTYQLLFLTMLCYLIRAIAIREVIFIVSNAVNLVITGMVLYLFEKYPSSSREIGEQETQPH